MDKLDQAIAAFEDVESDLTMGQRVNLLREALYWNAFEAIKRIKKYGTKSKISAEEEFKQVECMKHFKEIEKLYTSTLKTNKLEGKSEQQMNNDFLRTVKEMKGTMGTIVRDLKDGSNG